MKVQYVPDATDGWKYELLRQSTGAHLTVGISWKPLPEGGRLLRHWSLVFRLSTLPSARAASAARGTSDQSARNHMAHRDLRSATASRALANRPSRPFGSDRMTAIDGKLLQIQRDDRISGVE